MALYAVAKKQENRLRKPQIPWWRTSRPQGEGEGEKKEEGTERRKGERERGRGESVFSPQWLTRRSQRDVPGRDGQGGREGGEKEGNKKGGQRGWSLCTVACSMGRVISKNLKLGEYKKCYGVVGPWGGGVNLCKS